MHLLRKRETERQSTRSEVAPPTNTADLLHAREYIASLSSSSFSGGSLLTGQLFLFVSSLENAKNKCGQVRCVLICAERRAFFVFPREEFHVDAITTFVLPKCNNTVWRRINNLGDLREKILTRFRSICVLWSRFSLSLSGYSPCVDFFCCEIENVPKTPE